MRAAAALQSDQQELKLRKTLALAEIAIKLQSDQQELKFEKGIFPSSDNYGFNRTSRN